MNLDTDENLIRVVLDTNILVSAILFGGKPEKIMSLVIEEKLTGVTSSILISELKEVFSKKFPSSQSDLQIILKNIEDIFTIVQPKKTINIVKDEDDNRVLEAAIEGKCNYIVTGDKELLKLNSFKGIKILTSDDFLKILEPS